jgi:hypothetical protein
MNTQTLQLHRTIAGTTYYCERIGEYSTCKSLRDAMRFAGFKARIIRLNNSQYGCFVA